MAEPKRVWLMVEKKVGCFVGRTESGREVRAGITPADRALLMERMKDEFEIEELIQALAIFVYLIAREARKKTDAVSWATACHDMDNMCRELIDVKCGEQKRTVDVDELNSLRLATLGRKYVDDSFKN